MQYKALVVDDSKLARMVMVSAFRRIRPEWELIEATNADEALEAISARSVDVALVDFKMPVAVISANVQDEIIARARELSAAFVAKPLTDEALGAFLSGAALRLKNP